MDGVPVGGLKIVGQIDASNPLMFSAGQNALEIAYHDLIWTRSQQDVELDKVFTDVSVYKARVMGPAHVENVAELACRAALSFRGVSHITFPVDFQGMDAVRRGSKRNIPCGMYSAADEGYNQTVLSKKLLDEHHIAGRSTV